MNEFARNFAQGVVSQT